FRPAVYAGVPNLVDDELLPQANALLQTVENLSWAVGPVVGGLLTAAAGPSAAYGINAASFVVSILLVVRIPSKLLQSERALSRGYWRDLGDGFLAALRSRSMLAVLVAWGIASLGVGAANVSEIILAKHTFSSGDFGYGLLYGAIGGGLVLGSFASAGLLERWGVAAVCCVVFGIGNGAAVACNALLVQGGTFDLLRGRALTFVMSATYLAVAIGELVPGPFRSEEHTSEL